MLIHKILGLSLGMVLLSTAAFAETEVATSATPTPVQSADSVRDGMRNKAVDMEKMAQHREEMREKFVSRLDLTEEQQAKAKELHEKNRAEMKKIMDEIDSLQEKAKELREKSKTEFEALLTDQQKEKLKQMHEEHQAQKEKMKDMPNFKDKMKHKKHHFPHEKPMKPKED